MISARFAPGVAVLLALALVPTVRHSYLGQRDDDGRTAGAISESLLGLHSKATSRPVAWGQEAFDSHDWIERRYLDSGGREVQLLVARSYDLKKLYHHPELAAAYGRNLRAVGTIRLRTMPAVPVHVLRPLVDGQPGLAAYSLHYQEEFVDNPYISQLRTAWKLMFSNQKPMTLFFMYDPTFSPDGSFENGTGIAVLLEAIRGFLAQARP